MQILAAQARPVAIRPAALSPLRAFQTALDNAGIRVDGPLGEGKQGVTYAATLRGKNIVLKEAPASIGASELKALKDISRISRGRTPGVLFEAAGPQRMLYGITRGGSAMTPEFMALCKQDHALAIETGLGLLEALKATHDAGYWHGDLSRNNFLIEGNDPKTLMLIDFGLTLKLGEPLRYRKPPRVFMQAPETKDLGLVERMPFARPRQDLFAAAVHLATLVSGFTPYSVPEALKQDAAAWVHAYETGPRLGANVSPGLEAVLRRGLAYRSVERYQNADSFIEALAALRTTAH